MSKKESLICGFIAFFLIICFTVAYTNKRANEHRDASSDEIKISFLPPDPTNPYQNNTVPVTTEPSVTTELPAVTQPYSLITDEDGNIIGITTFPHDPDEGNQTETTTRSGPIGGPLY